MTYETPEVLEIGAAQDVIQGGKTIDGDDNGLPFTSGGLVFDDEE
jgi:hypothetical protein